MRRAARQDGLPGGSVGGSLVNQWNKRKNSVALEVLHKGPKRSPARKKTQEHKHWKRLRR